MNSINITHPKVPHSSDSSAFRMESFGGEIQGPIVTFVVGVHGNEQAPVRAIERIRSELLKNIPGTLRIIHANLQALDKNVRFIDRDLNNSFFGVDDGSHESHLAQQLKEVLHESDYTFDFHTTDFHIPGPYALVSVYSDAIGSMLEDIGMETAVFVDKDSLIKYAKNGIGFETGTESESGTVQNAYLLMKRILSCFHMIEPFLTTNKVPTKTLLVYNVIDKRNILRLTDIEDFKLVKKGQGIAIALDGSVVVAPEDFYPIWIHDSQYIRMAKRITIYE